jgi:TfoX/Sxy family transcriptional regulator of competence genes
MPSALNAHLVSLFESHVEGLQGVSRRKMFGCESFFRDGSIFGLIWKADRIGLKLKEPQSFEALLGLPGAEVWKAGTMAMSHWVLVPESFHDDEEALQDWIRRAHQETDAKVAKKEKARPKASPQRKSAAAPPKKKPRAR